MANLPIVKKNTELQKINKNLSIVNRLLQTVELQNSFDRLAWWNDLSQDWKNIFLSELNISEIELNQKPDFYLEKLFNITELWLMANQIQDISVLGDLTQLKKLWFDVNKIQDISALRNLIQLKTLSIGSNHIQDVSALGNLVQLTEIWLWANEIQDISALGNLTQLTELWLYNNQIQDFSPLAKLENLQSLSLFGNPVAKSDIDWLQSKLPNCWISY